MTGTRFRLSTAVVLLITLSLINQQAASASISYTRIALSGDHPVSSFEGAVFRDFLRTGINNAGQIFVQARTDVPNTTSTSYGGLWFGDPGNLTKVYERDDDAPGLPGRKIGPDYMEVSMNVHGDMALNVSVYSDAGIRDTIYYWSSGQLKLIALDRSDTSDNPLGEKFYGIYEAFLDDNNQLFFLTDVGYRYRQYLWRGTPDNLDVAWRISDFLDSNNIRIGSNGGATISGDTGHRTRPGNLQFIMHVGDPGLKYVTYESSTELLDSPLLYSGEVKHHDINNNNTVLFTGPLVDENGDPAGHAIGLWNDNQRSIIFRSGDPSPHPTMNAVFDSIGGRWIDINDRNEVVFRASIEGPGITTSNDQTLWAGEADNLRLLMQESSQAPGREAGVVFKSVAMHTINNLGTVIFTASVDGPGVIEGVNDFGMWTSRADGSVTHLLSHGDDYDVDMGPGLDLRTIKFFSPGFNVFNLSSSKMSLNDHNQFIFGLTFTDGSSGVFMTTIPEPGTLGVLAVGAGLIVGKRRHGLS